MKEERVNLNRNVQLRAAQIINTNCASAED